MIFRLMLASLLISNISNYLPRYLKQEASHVWPYRFDPVFFSRKLLLCWLVKLRGLVSIKTVFSVMVILLMYGQVTSRLQGSHGVMTFTTLSYLYSDIQLCSNNKLKHQCLITDLVYVDTAFVLKILDLLKRNN